MFTPQQRLIVEQAIAAYRAARQHRAELEHQINTVVPTAERRNMTQTLASMWRLVDDAVPEYIKTEYKKRRRALAASQSLN